MRVLQIISGFAVEGPLGGIERFGIELSRHLRLQGIEPIICGMWSYGQPYEHDWVSTLQAEGIEAFISAPWTEASPYRSFVEALRGTRAYIEGLPIDLIHSHCQFGDVLALLLNPDGVRGRLRTVHNTFEWKKRPLRRLFLTNLIYPVFFDQEIGVSQHIAGLLGRRPVRRLLPGERPIPIYNAIDVTRFAGKGENGVRTEFNLPTDATLIGAIGRLTEQKGFVDLVKAAAEVIRARSDCYFLIIGHGDQEEALKGLIRRLEIEDHVILTGPRSDIERLLGSIDLFVSSSLWEGLPTAIIESMLARVPVLATEIPGTTELVRDGETGFLVLPGKPDLLAGKILDLLSLSPVKQAAVTAAAQRFAAATFDIETIAAQHAVLYRKIFATKGKG